MINKYEYKVNVVTYPTESIFYDTSTDEVYIMLKTDTSKKSRVYIVSMNILTSTVNTKIIETLFFEMTSFVQSGVFYLDSDLSEVNIFYIGSVFGPITQ
jgi:hypothetical protein